MEHRLRRRFRRFRRDELNPSIAAHDRVTPGSALVGESLAGRFVLETPLVAPDLFDSYFAVDPSVWWNQQPLVRSAAARFAAWSTGPKQLFVTTTARSIRPRRSIRSRRSGHSHPCSRRRRRHRPH